MLWSALRQTYFYQKSLASSGATRFPHSVQGSSHSHTYSTTTMQGLFFILFTSSTPRLPTPINLILIQLWNQDVRVCLNPSLNHIQVIKLRFFEYICIKPSSKVAAAMYFGSAQVSSNHHRLLQQRSREKVIHYLWHRKHGPFTLAVAPLQRQPRFLVVGCWYELFFPLLLYR